jgi:hypothetical protein
MRWVAWSKKLNMRLISTLWTEKYTVVIITVFVDELKIWWAKNEKPLDAVPYTMPKIYHRFTKKSQRTRANVPCNLWVVVIEYPTNTPIFKQFRF